MPGRPMNVALRNPLLGRDISIRNESELDHNDPPGDRTDWIDDYLRAQRHGRGDRNDGPRAPHGDARVKNIRRMMQR